ncbi:hypothetical protein ANCCAN_30404 [Ancylostoma caninum]|uniref:Uncharacterized protein n=1 Tax=Ancylostoma caninum TaxID=29170 RepID=A0A368F144_ANCCA|nr:hypothetical protein ANCCAN_30404 [Ancylostoma caninum]
MGDIQKLLTASETCYGTHEVYYAVRELAEMLISSRINENLLLNELRSMSEEIKQLKAVVVKNEHRPLSKKVKFDAGMLTRAWLTPSSHIFRSVNLGKELQKYVAPARANSHSLLAVDFFRKILKNICVEPIHIWK